MRRVSLRCCATSHARINPQPVDADHRRRSLAGFPRLYDGIGEKQQICLWRFDKAPDRGADRSFAAVTGSFLHEYFGNLIAGQPTTEIERAAMIVERVETLRLERRRIDVMRSDIHRVQKAAPTTRDFDKGEIESKSGG